MERSLESLLQSIQTLQNTPSTVYTSNDVNTLQRLNEEFAAELATLRGRIDAVEARHSQLVKTYSTSNSTQTPQSASNLSIATVSSVNGNVQVRRASTVGTRGDIFRPVQVGDLLFSNDSIQMPAGASLSVQCRGTNGTLFPVAIQATTPRTLSGSAFCATPSTLRTLPRRIPGGGTR
ncbi:MAG: carbohydrate porin [Oscillatoriales cyanobacterium C42_A2020_001]|nr:carbohydrate porin [Leptolyngbyaceae cyanobacterium C42_A2020_001]